MGSIIHSIPVTDRYDATPAENIFVCHERYSSPLKNAPPPYLATLDCEFSQVTRCHISAPGVKGGKQAGKEGRTYIYLQRTATLDSHSVGNSGPILSRGNSSFDSNFIRGFQGMVYMIPRYSHERLVLDGGSACSGVGSKVGQCSVEYDLVFVVTP